MAAPLYTRSEAALRLTMEATRKQDAYATRRSDYTTMWRREYVRWQRDILANRMRLLRLIQARTKQLFPENR
jgi:hypothetical protein